MKDGYEQHQASSLDYTREPSALDRVNVRRALAYIKKVISQAYEGGVEQRMSEFIGAFAKDLVKRGVAQSMDVYKQENESNLGCANEEAKYIMMLQPAAPLEVVNVEFVIKEGITEATNAQTGCGCTSNDGIGKEAHATEHDAAVPQPEGECAVWGSRTTAG